MRERRKFVRIPEHLAISYKILPKEKTTGFLTRDISEGGIRFFAYDFIPKHSLLEVSINIEKVPFYFKSIVKVVWIDEKPRDERCEVGAEFVNISPGTKDKLVSYIQKVAKNK